MRYVIDHDLHIHSEISKCSSNPEQTPKNILKYAEDNGFKKICLTDHFWDDCVSDSLIECGREGMADYLEHSFEKLSTALPLPQGNNIRFLFGCETEMSIGNFFAIGKDRYDAFDFIIVPINHLHFKGLTRREADTTVESHVERYYERFNALLNSDLPLHKTGLAHPCCSLGTDAGKYFDYLSLLETPVLEGLFSRAATLGLAIEVNFNALSADEDILRKKADIYALAKKAGCKFYLGSDAHTPKGLSSACKKFNAAIDLLDLKEDDKSAFLK